MRQNGDTGDRVLRRAKFCLHVYTIKYLTLSSQKVEEYTKVTILTHRPVDATSASSATSLFLKASLREYRKLLTLSAFHNLSCRHLERRVEAYVSG